jgi:CheY-like chemotaxis protein
MVAKSKPAAEARLPLEGLRVLVVDDHSFTISLVKDVLYASGAQSVSTARDGAEALAMLRGCQPQLVVTDWRMPGLDGLAFTRTVRQAAVKADTRVPDPEIPIVLLSAHASALTVEAARRAGVSEVVVKPFPIAVLLQRIMAAIATPRPFVVAEAYVGPDRRRIRGGGDGFNRRSTDSDITTRNASDDVDSVLRRLQDELDGVEHKRRKAAARSARRHPV